MDKKTTEEQSKSNEIQEGVVIEIKTQSVDFTGYKMKDWTFYSSVMSMSSDKLMDQLSDKVGIMHLPEVLYGSNYLYITNPNFNIILDYNAVDSLSLSNYDQRELFLNKKQGINLFKLQNQN